VSVPAAIDLHSGCVRVIERNSRRGRKDVFDGIRVYAGILVNFQHRRSALNEIAGQLELQNVHLGGCFCKNDTGPACNEKSQQNQPTFASRNGHRMPYPDVADLYKAANSLLCKSYGAG
jgi:hypothetical protein